MQKSKYLLLIVMLVFAVALVGQAQDDDMGMTELYASIINPAGEQVGEVYFYEDSSMEGMVFVDAWVWGLEPGFHGFHIHGAGLCETDIESPFSTAGGHFNPDGTAHGEHAGDLPSLLVMQSGEAGLSFITDRFALADLLDDDGSAVMIHSGLDNFANIPERYGAADDATLGAGDAGSRAACGVITDEIPMMEVEG